MKLIKATVRNFRSIDEVGVTLELGRINVVAGINDVGKSSALLAIYAGLCLFVGKKENWIDRWLYLEGSTRTPGVSPEVELRFMITEQMVDDIKKRIKPDISSYVGEAVSSFQYITYKIPLDHRTEQGTNFYTYLGETHPEEGVPFIDHIADAITKKYASLVQPGIVFANENVTSFILQPIRERIDKVMAIFTPNHREFNPTRYISYEPGQDEYENPKLGPDTSELLKFIELLGSEEGMRSGKYERLLHYMKIIFPLIGGIEVKRPLMGKPPKDIFIYWDNQKRYQPLSRSGSGIANALYLVCRLLLDNNAPSIVLIDEPELGLHPKLQSQFISLFRKISEDFSVQWILATHSPFIMGRIKSEDRLYLMEHTGESSVCRQITVEKKSEVFTVMGAYLPEALTSNGMIFVEGQTEVVVLTILLKRAGLDIEKEGILIVPLGGDNLFFIKPSDLKRIHDKVMVIIDSDLKQSLDEGGHIKQNKLDYEKLCKDEHIHFYMNREFRTIENMYPKRALAKALGTEEELNHGNFGDIVGLADHRKISIGEAVANEMTDQEVFEFPYVQSVQNWWK